MDQKLEKLTDNVKDIKSLIQTFNTTLENIEKRLSRLEKVDSIEHRVTVNQIDLSDIKDALSRIEKTQTDEIIRLLKEFLNDDQLEYIHRRLDSHLIKLAKAEEEILMLKNK